MNKIVKKIVLGKGIAKDNLALNPLQEQYENLKSVWNNDKYEDIGLERLIRLVLAILQFCFPGIYIKYFFNKIGVEARVLAMDFYILFKTLLPLAILYFHFTHNQFLVYLISYFLLETFLYIPMQIFAIDKKISGSSYRRTQLLLLFNFLEAVFSFAYFHFTFQYFNKPLLDIVDAIYISFVITSTIGFGEYVPITQAGKILISFQSLFYLSYIILFINFANKKIS